MPARQYQFLNPGLRASAKTKKWGNNAIFVTGMPLHLFATRIPGVRTPSHYITLHLTAHVQTPLHLTASHYIPLHPTTTRYLFQRSNYLKVICNIL